MLSLRFPRRDVANLVAIDILTGSRDELSAGRFVHLQYRRDLRIGLVEDLMEEIGGAQEVETAVRAHGREPGRRRPYLAPVRVAPPEEAVLDGIFCVRARPENAISQPEQTGPRLLEQPEIGIIHR